MSQVFGDLARRLGAPYVELPERPAAKGPKHRVTPDALAGVFDRNIVDNDGRRCIFLSLHSRFPMMRSLTAAHAEEFRGIHIIRDPRDVCISAARYHGHAGESWLHIPRKNFGGLSYQQAINERESLSEKIAFEMRHSAKRVIEEMVQFDRQSLFRDFKYEDLISDTDMLLWHRVFLYLGFEGRELAAGLEAVWENSLFGDLGHAKRSTHVAHGGARQWEEILDPAALQKIDEQFGAAVASLGYGDAETD
jgi:hypothetical protein